MPVERNTQYQFFYWNSFLYMSLNSLFTASVSYQWRTVKSRMMIRGTVNIVYHNIDKIYIRIDGFEVYVIAVIYGSQCQEFVRPIAFRRSLISNV